MHRACVFMLAMLLSIAVTSCQSKTETKSAPPPSTPDFKVKASDLLGEYSANALAADKKYKGKYIVISGKYGQVQKVPLKGWTVQLLAEDAADLTANGVLCFVSKDAEDDVAKFKEGQLVSMQGTCDGQVGLGQVTLSKCTVAK